MHKVKKGSACLCICVQTHKCLCFSFGPCQAHSISVYNVEGRKDPVIPESSEADVRARQTGADGASSCFGKSLQGCLLVFEHSWRTKSPHAEVTIYAVMNLD